ncbi:MAG TPA: hypothetical protein DCR59_03865 [Dehalococcoidia bacterium]|nr:hypothetical protein [Dehalococcoidia bacterium]
MDKEDNLTITMTEAQSQVKILMMADVNYTQSSYRAASYTDIYRSHTFIMETPIEYLQKAAEEDTVHVF